MIRTITPNELDAFAAFAAHANSERVAAFVRDLWQRGESAPDQCLVAEVDGHTIGRMLWWRLASNPFDAYIGLLSLPWDGAWEDTGQAILARCIQDARDAGAHRLEANVLMNAPGGLERCAVLADADFIPVQEKVRLELDGDSPLPPHSSRLHVYTRAQLGDDQFIEAIEYVMQGTLDRLMARSIQHLGSREAAVDYFDLLADLDNHPDLWLLCFDTHGEFVGTVVAQRLSNSLGALNYVGVAPEQRGRGYGTDLVAEGIRRLMVTGLESVRVEVDARNRPMLAACHRNGFAEMGRTLIFGRGLDGASYV
ncbi:MAG: GNAT family N-acetyltransferase [Bacteroidetes bacterium]|nr:GNAT family N-acetyltransferase [Bacteroidota bacterium]